jgi:hypothetical protein
MLSNLSENFINNLGKDFEVLYDQVKDIVPDLNKWQLNNGYLFDEEKNIRVLFTETKKNGILCNKVYLKDLNSKEEIIMRFYDDKFFFEKEKSTPYEDSIRTSTYLFNEKDYVKKIYAFGCNEDYITLGIYLNKDNSKIEVTLDSNLDKDKLENILSKYDILNIRMCEGQKDIALLLESIYFGNFYYEYTERSIDNKDTYVIKKKEID